MRRKMIGYSFGVLGTFLILFGIVLVIFSHGNTPLLQDDKESSITYKNTTANLKKQHCIEYLCVTNLEIVNDSPEINIITGKLTNTSTNSISTGCFQFVFQVEKEKFVQSYCHLELEAGQSVPLELQYSENRIVKVKDYQLKALSEEEESKLLKPIN